MQLTLRQKLNVIVGAVASSFLVIMAFGWYLDSKMESQIVIIRDHFIPHVELGYRLESQFESIPLSLRDAVSAQDLNQLTSSVEIKNKLFQELNSASGIVDAQTIADFKTAVDDYFSIAMDTSTRLIKNETGLRIVDAMNQMQNKRAHADELLHRVTNFDRGKLRDAFVSIYSFNHSSSRIRFWVSLICVIFIFLVATLMARAIIFRLMEITQGVARFGEGLFDREIPVRGRDELSELSQNINLMAIHIQSLVRELEAFSYTIAHDLRAPLRSVVGFSTALSDDFGPKLPEEAQALIKRIVSSGQRMGKMIDGLLGLSRINRKTINKEPVNLSQIAERVLEVLKSNDPERKITLHVDQNLTAQGDSQLLDVALSNLIGNAWKFSTRNPEPAIRIGSKLENRATIYFVRDNGAGFDMRYADKLFGTFQRLHNDSEFEGHGIGLATVKNIIEKHGGRIWAESELNKGTTFYFTL